jgi:hypothetical protein
MSDVSALADKHAKAMRERDKAIRREHAKGKSTAAIAAVHGLTRQRVWQIVSEAK